MGTRRRTAGTGVTVAAICAAALAGGTASQAGEADVVNTRVSLEVKRDVRFKGKVRSPASDCAIGRKVLLYRAKPGRDDKIGKTFTSESGKYAVKIQGQQGKRVYAFVKRLRTPLDTICKGDRSRTLTV